MLKRFPFLLLILLTIIACDKNSNNNTLSPPENANTPLKMEQMTDADKKQFQLNRDLLKAVGENNIVLTKKLIEAGANVNFHHSAAPVIITCLDTAIAQNNYDITKHLIEKGADVNYNYPLDKAVYHGNLIIAQLLIDSGTKVDDLGPNMSGTALMTAVSHNKIEAVKLLLKNGADVNLRNKDGKTAIDIAREKGFNEILQVLKAANSI
jgi:ankyrin repeat protein